MNQFGANVRKQREQRGLSQEALAQKLGVHQTFIAHIENGRKNPSFRLAQRVATLFGVSLDALLTEGEPEYA